MGLSICTLMDCASHSRQHTSDPNLFKVVKCIIDPQMQQIVYHFPSYRIAFPASGTNRHSVVPHFFEDCCPRMAFLQSLRTRVATNDSVPLTGFTRRRLFTTSNAASAEKYEAESAERLGPEAAPSAPPSRFE